MTKLRVLDLFSGIGGFSLGLERTGGFETVAFCEIEEYPRRVLAKHWPKVPCYDDVRTLTADTLARDGIAVDVICGGFPYCLVEGLETFSETWPRSGTMRNGTAYRLQPLVPYTDATASGLWATPTVCGNYNRKGASATSGDGLATQVRMWPTPNASDGAKWSNQSLQERMSKGQQVRLTTAVSPQGGMGGALNPTWVEWLMGFPLGWTDLKGSATPSSHKSRSSSAKRSSKA